MSEQLVLKNNVLEVKISTMGAEIQSIVKNGKERIWEGDPKVWEGHAPVLFPICGGLKDGKFIYKDNEYFLKKHGFASDSEFEIEKSDQCSAVFLLKPNEESKKCYPFDYEFRVIYTLSENKINVEFSVTNTGNDSMYFSVGAHEAYACPEGIEDYSVIFECEEDLRSNLVNGSLLDYKTELIKEKTKELPLKNDYFVTDALVFTSLKSRSVTLKNRKTDETAKVYFNGADYLLLWTKVGAKYICIEPWCGLPDFIDSDYDITKKTGIIKAEAGETVVRSHSVEL